MKARGKLWGALAVVVIAVMVVGGLSVALLSSPSARGGKVTVYVKDMPASWSHINVTFSGVQIHAANSSAGAGWRNLALKVDTLDLASLVNVSGLLAEGSVGPGKYTQVRFTVTHVTGTMMGGTMVNFTVPSGELKTTHPFNVTSGSSTRLTLDIDLSRSIVQSDGRWMFMPVLGAIVQS